MFASDDSLLMNVGPSGIPPKFLLYPRPDGRGYYMAALRASHQLQRASAASTEFRAGGISSSAVSAYDLDRARRVPGDRCAAKRRPATTTEFRARRLVRSATRAAERCGRLPKTRLIEARVRRSWRDRYSRVQGRFRRHHVKIRITAAATKFCARGESGSTFCACNHCGSIDCQTGYASQAAAL